MDQSRITSQVEQADIEVTMEATRHRDHPLVRTIGALSEITDQPPAFTGAALAALAGLLLNRPKLAEAGLRSFAALGIATLVKGTIKSSVTRTRPFMLRDKGHYDTRVGGPDDGPWNSFPSGHTANAVAIARAVSRAYPDTAPGGVAFAAVVGGIQIPRGSHYPLDVAAGAVVGLLSEKVVAILWQRAPAAQPGCASQPRAAAE
ncbi:PAP2 superfamily protein [Paracoccus isoporae]|uniref:PAP2 superfamily protein n=1 Tax=Paracoccus isoporae TaxID=591205 RepID=A0A1G6W5B0_9RHOB|nr:phosphatase PAP2 family protein [Paracoccus isoporae]SDD60407.1 PAP2 superfamily protein [Paracoccus isoporae]